MNIGAALANTFVRNTVFVIAGLLVFALFWWAARTLRDLAGRWLVRHHVGGDAVQLGQRAVYVTLLIAGALTALAFAFQSGNLTIAGIVAATVVASFGVQDVLKNYVSGYYVLLEHHIRVGDTIALDGTTGTIEDIRLRVSLLRTNDGSLIVVPNAILFNNTVTVRAPKGSAKRAEDDTAEGVEPGGV